MIRPKPTTAANEERKAAAPAESWGEKEVAREIALLEAHVHQDFIHQLIDEALAVTESESSGVEGLSKETLLSNIEGELRESYLDYALRVISEELSSIDAIDAIRSLSRRGLSVFSRFAHGLTAAIAISRLQKEILTFMNLSKAAEVACNRVPLFAYGPELSEFRHRLR